MHARMEAMVWLQLSDPALRPNEHNRYSRLTNPTNEVFEKRLAALEGKTWKEDSKKQGTLHHLPPHTTPTQHNTQQAA